MIRNIMCSLTDVAILSSARVAHRQSAGFGLARGGRIEIEKEKGSVDIIRDGNGILAPEAKDNVHLSCAED